MSIVFLAHMSFVAITGIFTLGLGLYVYFNDRVAKANSYFLWMSVFLVSWLVSAFLGFMVFKDPSLCVALIKCDWASVSLFLLAWYFFFVSFPRKIKRPLILDRIVIASCLFFAFVILSTDFFIQGIEIDKFGEWGSNLVTGPGIELFYTVIGLFAISTLLIMGKRCSILPQEDRLKTIYLIMGGSFFLISNLIFNMIFPIVRGNTQYYQFGDYSVIFFFGFVTYAVIKHKLFGIKTIATTIFVALIFALLLLDFFFSWGHLVMQIFKGMVLLFFIGFAYLLIKSTKTEIKQKEKFSRLNEELEKEVRVRTKELEEKRDSLEIRVRARTRELAGLNKDLESKVQARTKDLNDKVVELEKFHHLTVDRELTMIELKKELRQLKQNLKE